MANKICLITGANSGIGKQAAIQIAGKGCHTILVCRNEKRGNQTLTEIKKRFPTLKVDLLIADLSERESMMHLADTFKSKHSCLDVLIHNAAIFDITQKKRNVNSQGIESVWATNHIGPVLLTELLLDEIKRSRQGRIITISSKGLIAKPFLKVDLLDPEFKTKKFSIVNAYYQSKLAQVMYSYWLAKRLVDTSVTVNCIRVPAVKIDISRYPDISRFMKWVYKMKSKSSMLPEDMARIYTYFATSPEPQGMTGKYFNEHKEEVNSGRYTKNPDAINDVLSLTRVYVPELAMFKGDNY